MSAFIYANGQYHALAGNKIVKDGQLLAMKDTDKIIAGGAAYSLGVATSQQNPSDPDAPAPIEFHATEEPTTGTVRYVTPDGAGTKDGSSWANAASGSMVHVILLQCASGDRVYFSEGEYTTDRVMTIPSGVNLYGGFRASDSYAWSGRNSFTNPTHFTKSGATAFAFITCTSSVSGQLIDGFETENYSGITTGNGAVSVRNYRYVSGLVDVSGSLSYAILDGLRSSTTVRGGGEYVQVLNTTNAKISFADDISHCDFFGASYVKIKIKNGNCTATNCTFTNCISKYDDDNNNCIVYGASTNCTFTNCNSHDNNNCIVYGASTNCTFTNCNSYNNIYGSGYSYIVNDTAKNCTFTNCTSKNGYSNCIVKDTAKNCTFTNCISKNDNRDYSNYRCIVYGASTNCTFTNCTSKTDDNGYSYIVYGTATNCTFTNCNSYSDGGIHYNIVKDTAKNCIVFNCEADTIFYSTATTCAQSKYASGNALTLGYDNTVARFVNTGFTPAIGVQDVGPCPNPLTDPDGYADYLALFGDWHPQADSFLIGRGTKDNNVTTDLDGITRPDPPTIGAYEPYPQNE